MAAKEEEKRNNGFPSVEAGFTDNSLHGQSQPEVDTPEERKLLWKLDLTVIPTLWFLFLVSFIDRGNLGNARIEGLEKSLHMSGNDYNVAILVFTITYVVFGLPANIIFKRYGPKVLSAMMFSWGICTLGQGLTESFGGLVTCRLLMGICEAGFVPGCAYLISTYYKRNEFLRRYAIFFSAMMAAGAFNGLFANLLSRMHGVGGYEGWRWIFIIEALVTLIVSVISYFLIVPFPEDCRFLDPDQKRLLLDRLEADGGNVRNDSIELKRVLPMAMDWKIWLAILGYIGGEETASSIVAFQPTILSQLGWTSSEAQIHTIPVYAVAFVVTLACAILSDHTHKRYIFILFGMICITIGWSIQLAQVPHPRVRYMGMFFVSAGSYVMMSNIVVWLAINLGKGLKRNVGLGMLISFGNCGAFISSNVFISEQAPRYPVGFGVGLAMSLVAGVAVTALFIGLVLENRRRDRLQSSGTRTYSMKDLERMQDLGEEHPDFRYQV